MKTIEKTVYSYEELSDEAKTKALNSHHDWHTVHEDWHEYVYEDAKEIGKLLGLDIDKIYFSGFSSQGDGACFECSFSYAKGTAQKIREYAPVDNELHRIASEIAELHRKSFYSTNGTTSHRGHYYHEYSMHVDVESEYGEADFDAWKEVIADFARWIYARLEKEYDYQTSDEVISESLISNEIEFSEDGEAI